MTTALLKRRPCRVVAYASYRCRRNRTRIDALRVKVYAHALCEQLRLPRARAVDVTYGGEFIARYVGS